MSSLYPLWIEKLIFIILSAGAVYAGIMLGKNLSGAALWATRICALPIAILVITEGIGRMIQSQYVK